MKAPPFIDLSLPFLDLSLPFLDLSLPFLRLALPFLDLVLPLLDLVLPLLDLSLLFIDLVLPFNRCPVLPNSTDLLVLLSPLSSLQGIPASAFCESWCKLTVRSG